MFILLFLLIINKIIFVEGNNDNSLFPLFGAIFLPNDVEIEKNERKDDLAIEDAYFRFLLKWTNNPKWLVIGQTKSILQCHAQRHAAWAVLEALQWNDNKGINVAFGPACDYLVATIMRILSYKKIPIITNSHSSIQLIEFFFHRMNWSHSRVFYEKQFWQNELHEAGSCRLFSSGFFLRAKKNKWGVEADLIVSPTSTDSAFNRQQYKQLLIEKAGNNYSGGFG
uniref:Receptor ligand binding region domain-containing protein n=1 Tax=Meloidogyne floridensis TaxID=298350 RepID=A0A915P8A0_9BILA